MRMTVTTSYDLPEFLTTYDHDAATSNFRPPRINRHRHTAQSRNRKKRAPKAGKGPRRRCILDSVPHSLPALPHRYLTLIRICRKLEIPLDEPAWTSLLDRSTWTTAIIDCLDFRVDDEVICLRLINGTTLRASMSEVMETVGQRGSLEVHLEEFAVSLHEAYIALSHRDAANVEEICDDPESIRSLSSDADFQMSSCNGALLDTSQEFAGLLRTARARLLDTYRRFILPWLRLQLPPNFLLWAIDNALKQAASAFYSTAGKLAEVVEKGLKRSSNAEIRLWSQAALVTARCKRHRAGERQLTDRNGSEDWSRDLQCRETPDDISYDTSSPDPANAEDEFTDDEELDVEQSFGPAIADHMMDEVVAREILLALVEERDAATMTDELLHFQCLMPPLPTRDISDLFDQLRASVHADVDEAYSRLLDHQSRLLDLHKALRQARENEHHFQSEQRNSVETKLPKRSTLRQELHLSLPEVPDVNSVLALHQIRDDLAPLPAERCKIESEPSNALQNLIPRCMRTSGRLPDPMRPHVKKLQRETPWADLRLKFNDQCTNERKRLPAPVTTDMSKKRRVSALNEVAAAAVRQAITHES